MPRRPARACPVCGGRVAADARHRHAPGPAPVPTSERRRRVAVVAEHVRLHGLVCPGWNRAPHGSADLTADHIIPRAAGGEHGPLRVLCRSCNSRRGTGGVM
ncbi:HNH endonuclease [bacterium]|nr:HNH endonuclease [bacterium]